MQLRTLRSLLRVCMIDLPAHHRVVSTLHCVNVSIILRTDIAFLSVRESDVQIVWKIIANYSTEYSVRTTEENRMHVSLYVCAESPELL